MTTDRHDDEDTWFEEVERLPPPSGPEPVPTSKIERGSGRPLGGGYRTKAGQRCPSVTTVLGMLDKPGLRKWYWECGLAGTDPRKLRDTAGGVGSAVHTAIEQHIHGGDPQAALDSILTDEEDRAKGHRALDRFFAWEDEHKPVYLATEIALVSEEHELGGTLDILCRIGDALTIVDAKTGKGPYTEQILQLAAYAYLLEEARGETPEQVALVFIGDEVRRAHNVYPFTALGPAWTLFRHILAAYREQRAVEALVAR